MFTLFPRSALLATVYQLGFSLLSALFPCAADSQQTAASDAASDWQRYVRAPPSRLVRPKAILSQYTLGSVVNPDGLITGLGPTLLLRSSDGGGNASSSTAAAITPMLVIDFGQNVVGQPVIDFAGATNASSAVGFPGLRLTFSESLEFLGNRSDFTRSDNAESVSKPCPLNAHVVVQKD